VKRALAGVARDRPEGQDDTDNTSGYQRDG